MIAVLSFSSRENRKLLDYLNSMIKHQLKIHDNEWLIDINTRTPIQC